MSSRRSRRGNSSTNRSAGLLPNQAEAAPTFFRSAAGSAQAPASVPAQLALALGIKPQVTTSIVELALYRYPRSKWLPLDVALLLVLFLICFRYPFGTVYFYDISTFGLGAIVVLTTYGLVHSLLHPITYLRIGLRSSLRSMLVGLTLASAAIATLLLLSLLFLALITGRFAETTPGPLIAGGVGLLANSILLGAVTIALSTPASTIITRLSFLVWLVLALASYNASGLLGILLFPFRLPLLPFAACYDFGVTGVIGWGGLLALVGQLIGIGGIIWYCEARLSRPSFRSRA